MKFGVISDIHGNLEVLEAALKKLEREKVDEIVCLGDVAGYGATRTNAARWSASIAPLPCWATTTSGRCIRPT